MQHIAHIEFGTVQKVCIYSRYWEILQKAQESFVANIGFDAVENEPRQVCCMIRAREPWFGFLSVPSSG